MSLLFGLAFTCAGTSGTATTTASQEVDVSNLSTSELATRVELDGSGPWYQLLGSGDAAAVALAVTEGAMGRPPVLLSAGDSDLSRTPESIRHLVEDAVLTDDGGTRTLVFWFAYPPSFGPTRLAVTATSASATVEQASLDDLLTDDQRTELMLGYLVSDSRQSRKAAADHFAASPDERAIPACITGLQDAWVDMRAAAARCLGANTSSDAIAPLGAALLAEQEGTPAWDMAKALVAHGSDARAALESAASGGSESAAAAASWGVSQL